MPEADTPSCVVVGVDGSRAAVAAAVWAVDEAVARDIPVRLVHVVDDQRKSGLAVLREAHIAAEATGQPVKIETEIMHGRPLAALLAASHSAAMVCVGPIGLRRSAIPIGSTAAGLVSSARCPVAIVRSHAAADGWVVVEADDSPTDSAVLQRAIDEALLRGGRLQVVTTWHPDIHGADAPGGQRVAAQLGRRIAPWIRRYPDLDIRPVAVRGKILNYLIKHADSVQLVVVGKNVSGDVAELVGPAGHAALRHTGCSVLVVCPRYL